MPTLTAYERLCRHNARKKEVKDKANDMVRAKIRRLVERDKYLYNGMFAYPLIRKYARKEKVSFSQMMVIMLMDLYTIFTFKDAAIWGYNYKTFNRITLALIEKGYMERRRNRRINYYLTLKGEQVVKEFNIVYDEQVKAVLTSVGDGEYSVYRKVTRKQSARIYKPPNMPSSRKPKRDSQRGGTEEPN